MQNSIDNDVIRSIVDVLATFDDLNLTGVVIGGIAVSLIAEERFTKDIDALVLLDNQRVEELLTALKKRHFVPRFSEMAEFGRQSLFITVAHEERGSIVDIALGCMPFEEELVARATIYPTQEGDIRLPTPEDLVILKAIAKRPKDLEDIRNIAAVYPSMDLKRIKYWVSAYAELLETPELWSEIELLLKLS